MKEPGETDGQLRLQAHRVRTLAFADTLEFLRSGKPTPGLLSPCQRYKVKEQQHVTHTKSKGDIPKKVL